MIVETLELKDFRNYEDLKLELDPNINIFYGKNGQGKTNILEAIYLSSTTRSHRGSKDKEMIHFGCEEAHIKTVISKQKKHTTVDMQLRKRNAKGIAINHVPIRKAADLFGTLNVVVFSPEDLQLIKKGPLERRNFINQTICQIDKVYVYDLSYYHKALEQRNKLLKDIYFHPELKDTLEIWDMQLIESGRKLIKRRRELIDDLNKKIKPIHASITAGKEEIEVIYNANTTEEEYEQQFIKNRDRDLKEALTHVGPHRDDISFMVNGIDMRHFGSQGQQRTTALSLKIASIDLIWQTVNDLPVLLLDDVLSELDRDRQTLLLQYIKDIQTIITCTGFDDFVENRFHLDKVFEVDNGKVSIQS